MPRGVAALSRVEPGVNVVWRGAAPAPGVPGQGFSVRWTGYLRAPETGLYVLHTEFDDATDISFAGENVLSMTKYEPEFFLPHKPPVPVDVVKSFRAGELYRVDLAYKDVRGMSRAVLSWARPSSLGNPTHLEQAFAAAKGQRPTVIPTAFLYPELPRPVPVAAPPMVVARPAARRVVARPIAVLQPVRRPAPPRPLALAERAVAAVAPTPITAAVPLLPTDLRRGTTVALPNLYFAQGTANLLPASRPVLNTLTSELQARPALRLEVAGHTDNQGDARLNLLLSERRAQVVRRYLVQQGVDSLRLSARGYGGTRPVADNRDPRQRPRNRRVEVVGQ